MQNTNLQRGNKKTQEEKTQMDTNEVAKHRKTIRSQKTSPTLASTTKTNNTDKTSKKFNTTHASPNTSNSRKQETIMLMD